MSWMAPIPTRDISMPAHWVRPATEYVPVGRLYDGSISPAGWPAVCGAVVSWIPEDVDNTDRQVCRDCAAAAPYPFHSEEADE